MLRKKVQLGFGTQSVSWSLSHGTLFTLALCSSQSKHQKCKMDASENSFPVNNKTTNRGTAKGGEGPWRILRLQHSCVLISLTLFGV